MRYLAKINITDQIKVIKMNDHPLVKLKKCLYEGEDILIKKRLSGSSTPTPEPEPEPQLEPGLYDADYNLLLPLTKEMVATNYTLSNYPAKSIKEYTNANYIIFPPDVTYIGENHFFGCRSLKMLNIPEGVESIGTGAFSGCTKLEQTILPSTITNIAPRSFGTSTTGKLIVKCNIADVTGYSTNYTQAPFYNSGFTEIEIVDGVTKLGDYAFESCVSATTVKIANTVTSIGERAFENCKALTSINIPGSVIAMGSTVFNGDNNLLTAGPIGSGSNIEFGWTNTIPDYAFSDCSITSIDIPNGITSIGERAFKNCIYLKSITIPNSVEYIGTEAFYKCGGLESVILSNKLKLIKQSTFEDCKNLKLIILPDSLIEIENIAFRNCTGLSSVVFSNNITTIGVSAFNGCTALTDAHIPNSVISIGNYAFRNVPHIYYSGTATGSPWGAKAIN